MFSRRESLLFREQHEIKVKLFLKKGDADNVEQTGK